MYKWILPGVGEVLAVNSSARGTTSLETAVMGSNFHTQQNFQKNIQQHNIQQHNINTQAIPDTSAKAESQWRISIAAVEQLLLNHLAFTPGHPKRGFAFAAPAPVFSHPIIAHHLETITFATQAFNRLALMPFPMGNNGSHHPSSHISDNSIPSERVLPLLPVDPIAQERFCLVVADGFQVVLVLTEDGKGGKDFQFSFAPDVISQVWQALAGRVKLVNPDWSDKLDRLVQPYLDIEPDYKILTEFSQLLLAQISVETPQRFSQVTNENYNYDTHEQSTVISAEEVEFSDRKPKSTPCVDAELLQAFAHEVRTPLATIRTLASLILRQKDLPANLLKRVQMIERECLEQIDRMELLFRAAELETSTTVKSTSTTHLTPMCLEQVLQESIPRWQQFASRRNLTLDVVLPQKLPTVVSNPNMLDRMLTGLIENFTRSLPSGSHIQVQVIPAGNQLKLQLLPLPPDDESATEIHSTPPIRKAIGELLMFQPETGTISLNLAATKHLFQAIGGKLIVRQRPQYGEVLTIFLPLESMDEQLTVNG